MSATTSSAAAATPTGNRAPSQGGVIEGANPSAYNPKDPITMFIIQAGLIIVVCHILHWPLKKIRQPRVIAEVIGGILLGPSVMGRYVLSSPFLNFCCLGSSTVCAPETKRTFLTT